MLSFNFLSSDFESQNFVFFIGIGSVVVAF